MKKIDGTNGTKGTYGTYDFFLRPIGLIGLIGPILFSTIALAQTTASPVQSAIGTACAGKANSADFDAIAQCGGATMQRAPLQVGTVTVPPYADIKCTPDKAGMIQWDGKSIKACDGSMWVYFVLVDPCTDDTPDIGTICKDGSIYVGKTPDGGGKMFMTRCDVGRTWDQTTQTCSGGGNVFINWQSGANGTGVVTGVTNTITGQANTAQLVALGSAAPGPYPAAKTCDDLVANGHSDWYLPARDEVALLRTAGLSPLGHGTAWSSTESDANNAFAVYFAALDPRPKMGSAIAVRCVRKG